VKAPPKRKDHAKDVTVTLMGSREADRSRPTPDPKGRSEPGYTHHLFVCTNVRPEGAKRTCCGSRNSKEILVAMKKHARTIGLEGRVQSSGCLDFCEQGPSVAHYPDGGWFGPILTPEEGCALLDALLVGDPSDFAIQLAG